jgi:hypothetical protein
MNDFVIKCTTAAEVISVEGCDRTPWMFYEDAYYCRVRISFIPAVTIVATGNEPYELAEGVVVGVFA